MPVCNKDSVNTNTIIELRYIHFWQPRIQKLIYVTPGNSGCIIIIIIITFVSAIIANRKISSEVVLCWTRHEKLKSVKNKCFVYFNIVYLN